MYIYIYIIYKSFSGSSEVKDLPATAGDKGSIPGWGRFPGEGDDNPLQCSSLENSMDRGPYSRVVVVSHGVTKS